MGIAHLTLDQNANLRDLSGVYPKLEDKVTQRTPPVQSNDPEHIEGING